MQEITVWLPLDKVRPSPRNPRPAGPDPQLEDLASSLCPPPRGQGQLQPCVVRRIMHSAEEPEGYYELVCGHRRRAAAELAGLPKILCRVVELDDRGAIEAALVENAARRDVHPLDESDALGLLLQMGADLEELTARLQRSQKWVRDRMALRYLSPGLRTRFNLGNMGLRAAAVLAHMPDAQQEELAKQEYVWPMSYGQAVTRTCARALSKAPWDLDDASLGGQGACGPCIYRSDVQPDLLAPEGGAVRCTNTACWDTKRNAWCERQGAAGATVQPLDRYAPYTDLTLGEAAPAPVVRAVLGLAAGEDVPRRTWAELVPTARRTLWPRSQGAVEVTASRETVAAALNAAGLTAAAELVVPPRVTSPEGQPEAVKLKPAALAATVTKIADVVAAKPELITLRDLAETIAGLTRVDDARVVARQLGLVPSELGYLTHWLVSHARTCPADQLHRLLALMMVANAVAHTLRNGGETESTSDLAVWLERTGVEAPAGLTVRPSRPWLTPAPAAEAL